MMYETCGMAPAVVLQSYLAGFSRLLKTEREEMSRKNTGEFLFLLKTFLCELNYTQLLHHLIMTLFFQKNEIVITFNEIVSSAKFR